jgi:hypothetical protein
MASMGVLKCTHGKGLICSVGHFVFVALFLGCASNSKPLAPTESPLAWHQETKTAVSVGRLDESGAHLALPEGFPTSFKDGTPVQKTQIEKLGDTYYLVASFVNAGLKTCRNHYILLRQTTDKRLVIDPNTMAGTCTGVNCSWCVHLVGDGCSCKGGPGSCNHTITWAF